MYRRGMGASCAGQTASIFSQPGVVWDYMLHGCPTSIGVPPAPTGAVLTVPPAGEADAQATVDGLLNQELESQKAANASGVESSWADMFASGVVATGDALGGPLGVPWWAWLAGGVAVFALVALPAGSPRRYGR